MSIARIHTFITGETLTASLLNTEYDNLANNAASDGANSDITSLAGLTTALSVAQGGTGSTTAGAARTALSAAVSGANGDITSLTGLTTALSIAQGGTAGTTASAARTALGVPGLADANTFTESQTVQSADAGAAVGPNIVLDRNSASPLTGDGLGRVQYRGRDSGAGVEAYAETYASIVDPTASSEDGQYIISTVSAGTLAARITVGAGTQIGAPTGGDKGAGTINLTEAPYVNGERISQFKKGTFTRDLTAAAGTQSITGVGFTPKAVFFIAVHSAGNIFGMWGFDTGGGGGSGGLIADQGSASANYGTDSSYSLHGLSSTGNFQQGSPAFTADGFDITWAKTGTPTGTLTVQYLAMR